MSILTELQTDPAGLGYVSALAANNDEGVAALGNTATLPAIGLLSRTDLAKWAAKTGMRLVIQQEADNQSSPLCSLALTIIDVLRGASGGIDCTDVDNIASLGAWVASGKLSSANRDLMLAMATKQLPRNVVLFGRLLTANDIARTVRDDAGNSLL